MCYFIFSKTFVWNIFHFKNNWTRYEKIYVGFYVKYPLCKVTFM
jgi:hypothetical protein